MNLKDILERLKDYLAVIKKWWYLIALAVLICGGGLWFFAYTSPKVYYANSIFHPDLNKTQGGGVIPGNPLSAILGSNGEGAETGFMVEILKSRNISESVVQDTAVINGDSILMADLVLNSFPKRFNFFQWVKELFSGPPKAMSYDKKIISAASIVRSSTTLSTTNSGFIKMKFAAFDRNLANLASEKLISGLDRYYRGQKTEKARQNLAFFALRADSVKNELEKINRAVANYYDRTKFGVKSAGSLYPSEMAMKQELLREMYITLEINKEQSKAQLQEKIPVIQVLDPPNPPYTTSKRSNSLFLFIGIFLGFVGPVLLICRKLLIEDITNIIKNQLFAENSETE